jgi:hypothetical protein
MRAMFIVHGKLRRTAARLIAQYNRTLKMALPFAR